MCEEAFRQEHCMVMVAANELQPPDIAMQAGVLAQAILDRGICHGGNADICTNPFGKEAVNVIHAVQVAVEATADVSRSNSSVLFSC